MRKIILDYLHYLEMGSYDHLIKLFAPNAIVYSPLYGDKNAAAQFQYDWTLSNGIEAPFEVVDMFQFNETGDKIVSLKIIYDTWHTRNKVNL